MMTLFLLVVLPALIGWYVVPKLAFWSSVQWGGFPQGWVGRDGSDIPAIRGHVPRRRWAREERHREQLHVHLVVDHRALRGHSTNLYGPHGPAGGGRRCDVEYETLQRLHARAHPFRWLHRLLAVVE